MKKLILPAALLGLAVACGTPAAQKNLTENPSKNLTTQAAPINALPRTGWNVQYGPASSNNPNLILDGNEGTVWTSSGNQSNSLEGLHIDLGAVRSFNKIVLEAGNGSQNYLRSLNVFLSSSPGPWGPVIASKTGNTQQRLEINLGARSGRYLTLQVGSENPGKPWGIAELWLVGSSPSPIASGFEVKRAINISTIDSKYIGMPLPSDQIGRIKRAGFDTLRLVTDVALENDPASRYIDPNGNFTPNGKARVDAAVSNALNAGLKVIVDIHTVFNFPGTNTTFNDAVLCGGKMAEFEKFLEQVARHLTKYPRSRVALELMNEPNDNGCPNLQASYPGQVKRMFNAARRGSSDMMLILSPLGNSSPQTGDLDVLNGFLAEYRSDLNKMVTVHVYGALAFSHQGATWVGGQSFLNCFERIPYPSKGPGVETSASVRARTMAKVRATPFCGGEGAVQAATESLNEHLNFNKGAGFGPDDLDYLAQQVRLWANARGLPASKIFLGEFGVLGSQPTSDTSNGSLKPVGPTDANRAAWIRDTRLSFERQGFSWAYFTYSGGGYAILKDRGYPTQNFAIWDPNVTTALGITTP